MRKTKIICTLGPAVDNPEILERLMRKGMDVARMNFSHGDHDEHKKRLENFKKVRDKLGLPIPMLLDTKGPEIRIGRFESGEATLVEGHPFTLVHDDILGDNTKVSVTYKELYKDVSRATRILINDGLIELEVEQIRGKDIHCTVRNGGSIGDKKGINVPGVEINLPSLTDKDIEDIQFGIENGFDFIAASFVRKAQDVMEIKKILEKNDGHGIMVIAKIENRQGVDNIDEILKVSDGIMVARGDLGVEIPVEEVPIVQKMLIDKCYRNGKPVITATQMLDSMIRNPRPTRAEASDVANAIFDGTSVIMLSGETAAGKYPLESMDTMARIALKAEKAINYWKEFSAMRYDMEVSITNAISHATCTTAMDLDAVAIVTVTQSGRTARMISRFRPDCPIIATTTSQMVQRQLNMSWGVTPFLVRVAQSTDEMFDMGVDKALESGLAKNGDVVVITAGVPAGISGTTNILKVQTVGKVLVRGNGTGTGVFTGELCVVRTPQEAEELFKDGNILVAPYTSNEMLPIIKRASAVIVEESGANVHASIVGMALEIPVITGAENAVQILKQGSVVTVDSDRGIVYYGSQRLEE
ncbi:MAG: pyruvate kinase [Caldicoprobacterales bacterium]